MSYLSNLWRAMRGQTIPAGARPDQNNPRIWTPIGGGAAGAHRTALQIGIVLACVKAISESLASLPLLVHEGSRNGDSEPREDHWLSRLLNDRPNPEQSALEFREQLTAWTLLRGTALAEIIPGTRDPVDALIPLSPNSVRPVVATDPQGRRQPQIEVVDDNGRTRRLLWSDVFVVRGLMLDGSLWGLDPISAQAIAVGAAAAVQDYAARFFSNDARPGVYIEHPGHFKTTDDRDRFLDAWAHRFRAGVHSPGVLEHGMTLKQISVTPEQAQFLATREYSDLALCRIFRVPPSKVGITAAQPRANAEQQALEWSTDTIAPWARRWESAASRDLLLQPGRFFLSHDLTELTRGDFESRQRGYALGRQWGYLSVNDIRRSENRNGIGPAGDRYLEPVNMIEAPATATASAGEVAPRSPVSIGDLELDVIGFEALTADEREKLTAWLRREFAPVPPAGAAGANGSHREH